METPSDWDQSASAWLEWLGEEGDFARRFVIDAPMLECVRNRGFTSALDVGCGEGRFCRMLQRLGLTTVGIDPTFALIEQAKTLDPHGEYRVARAEQLGVGRGCFDVAICYLSMIDIPDLERAITEIAKALRPRGTFVIANITSFSSTGPGWTTDADGIERFCVDRYFDERADWVSWAKIRVRNYHRPMSTYMTALLESGFELRHFSEPHPSGGDARTIERYNRAPWFYVMSWQKSR